MTIATAYMTAYIMLRGLYHCQHRVHWAHRLAQVSDAPDLEGAGGLSAVQLEVDGGAGQLGQGQALPQRGGHVQAGALGGLHDCLFFLSLSL